MLPWTCISLLLGFVQLLHFREIAQPLLPAVDPKLNLRLEPIVPRIPFTREASNSDNDRAVLQSVSQKCLPS